MDVRKQDLDGFVRLGLVRKVDNHCEHFAVQPCWIQDPAKGVQEEITNSVLGRWNSKLEAYVVCVENLRNHDRSAGMNEDHRWLHIDISATYYVYSPEEGQRLKGEIKKIGNLAAICIVFDVFTVTVFANDDEELKGWKEGDILDFVIYSFEHRRKGPIIRSKSIGITCETTLTEVSEPSAKKKKKKRKHSDNE